MQASRAEPRFRASLTVRLILLCGSLVVAALLVEALLRLSPVFRPTSRTYVGEYANRPSQTFVADPDTGWRMRPGPPFASIYQSNAQGFRRPGDFDPHETRKKIALVGDSFTFGWDVEYPQTYGAQLEAALPGTVVYNLAMPGFGLDQMWLSVRTQALPLKPDLVVVAFISPDFTRSEEAYRLIEGFNKPVFKLVDGRLVPQTAADRPNAVVRFLQHHSSLWRLGRLALRRVAHQIPVGEWWSLNRAILDAIQADCRQRGVPLLFVYLPAKEWSHFPEIRSYMTRVGARFVDLSDPAHRLTPELYFPGQGAHPNPEGHRFIAKILLDWIRRNMPELAAEDPGRSLSPR